MGVSSERPNLDTEEEKSNNTTHEPP